jgi:predicted nucleic acid-binding protein
MPEAAAVLDASPLILLSRIRRLDLLLTLRRRLVVPVPVLEEIRAKGNQDPSVREIQQASYLEEVPALPVAESIRRWDLGRGESSVLAWARERPGALALLDDLQARRCAESQGIPLLGTAGLVLLAKRRGLIPAAAPVLRELVAGGMYLSESLVAELLRRAGE